MRNLGTIGGDNSEALAINEAGQVVGRADVANTPFHHAFLWQDGTMTDLGVASPCQNSTANSINSGGQIVGGMGRCATTPDDITYNRKRASRKLSSTDGDAIRIDGVREHNALILGFELKVSGPDSLSSEQRKTIA